MDVIETDTADVQVNSAGATSYVNNYKIMNMLGEGTFSKVYLCQNDAGSDFALKIINKSILKRKREYKRVGGKLVLSNAFQKVQKEVAIMKKLAHSNLVRLYEVIDSPADDKLFLVLELIRGGQIMYWDDKTFRYFSRNTPTGVLDKDTVRACMRDVVAALDFLHRNHICHRDIKPENILLSGSQYKLADFGVAYMNDDEPTAAVPAGDAGALKLRSTEGTYHFLAPECTTGEEYDAYQVDVWALGVTMFTLLVGTLPFGTGVASLSDVMTSIREDPLILPPDLDAECAGLLTQLMEKNPHLRITVPQLRAHPWVSGAGGELARRPSDLEVMVTQQEIEAAFTPVNNFILVMKLKMKMSSRLNNVRKSLAGKVNRTRRTDAVPVTEHVPASPSQNDSSADRVEMAPGEQPRVMSDRLQRRSSRLMESVSESIGSLSTTLTRRKSQLGAVAPVFDSAAPTMSSPESSPGKADAGGRPGVLRRQMSRRSSRSVQSLIPDIAQRADSAKAIEPPSSEESRTDLSPGRTEAPKSSHNNSPPNGKASPDRARLTKRKSSSFRGFAKPSNAPECDNAAEPSSPTTTKKRRESLPGKNDDSSIVSAQQAAQNVAIVSPVDKNTTPTPSRLTRQNSMSFRALVTTPEVSSPREDTTGAPQSRAVDTQGAEPSTSSHTSTRPVMLSRRLSRRNARSFRGISTAPDSLKREGTSQETDTFPNVTRREHTLAKVDFSGSTVVPNDSVDSVVPVDADQALIKPESTSPPALRGLSKRNSTSFIALVSTPDVAVNGGFTQVEGADSNDAKGLSPLGEREAVIADAVAASVASKSPAKAGPTSPASLLARRLSRRDSTSLRALPLTVNVEAEDTKHDLLSARRATLSKLSPGKKQTDDGDDLLLSTSPSARSADATYSLQMNSSRSPLGSPKVRGNVDEEIPLQKPKLPVLEILSPLGSPVASSAASPRKAANVPEDEESSPPKRRSSNPSNTLAPARGHSDSKVSPLLLRKRSSSLRLDGMSSGSEDEKRGDSASTGESDACTASTVEPTASTAPPLSSPPDASARGAPFSTPKPTAPLLGQDTSPQPPLRRLHRNRSVSSVDGEGPAFARKTSLAKVLDECITTDRAADRRAETAPSSISAAPETEAALSPLTPTRRHPMHVPPLERPGDPPCRQSHSMVSYGRHHHISPLGSIEKPVASPSSPPPLDKQRSRRKSLVQAQDSLRLLFRGQSSARLGLLEEKRGAHHVADDKLSRVKSKVCVLM